MASNGVSNSWWRPFGPPLLIVLLAVPAMQPLFSNQLTCGFDNTFHLWRSFEIANLLQSGVMFSRWAPHMARGYGYPLYLFQSPLSAYGTAVFRLIGFSWPTALNGMYALGLLLSALATWWLVRDLWGELGGIVAAVAMLFAPYHLYVVMYRGSLSETVAWVFPPLVLWGLRRWQLFGQRRGVGTAVLALAALFFAHDVTAYAFLPFFAVWVVGMSWGEIGTRINTDEHRFWHPFSWKRLGRGGLALLLGMGGGAFFWLPAVVERSSIQFSRANSAWPFLYSNNFLPLDQLLALPRQADPLLLNDWPARGLGAVIFVCLFVGLLVGWRLGGERRWVTAVLAFIFAAYLFLILPISTFLWDSIDILAAFQFPWRFLAPATLAAVILMGAVGGRRNRLSVIGYRSDGAAIPITDYGLPITLTAVLLLSIAHWGWLYPDHCDLPADISLKGMVAWEQDTRTLGTTASRELLPVTVAQVPQEPDLPPPWQARIVPQDLPDGAQILSAEYGALDADIELETPTDFTARYRAFAFPGWQVTVNGDVVPITPSDPGGLITFDVPNGRSTIHVTFTETPLRRLSDIISILSLITLLTLPILTPSPKHPQVVHPFTLSPCHLVTFIFLAFVLIAAKIWLADTQRLPLYQTAFVEGELRGVDVPMSLTFGTPGNPNQVRLLGHDGVETAVSLTDPLPVTLYWHALTPLSQNVRVGLTLVDADGLRWSADGLRDIRWVRNPGSSTTWPTDDYVLTGYNVDPLPGTPPGTYTLLLSLFDEATFAPLTISAGSGQMIGPSIPLAEVVLTPSRQPWRLDEMAMQTRLDAELSGLTLWGSDVDRQEAAPGDSVLVTLYWSADEDVVGTLALVDGEGTAAATLPVTLNTPGAGVWRHQQLVRLPVNLADGTYQWQFTGEDGEAVQWGEMRIDAPERLFAEPPTTRLIETAFSQQAMLVGANVRDAAAGEPLTIELVWQGLAEMAESYRVFVHLLDADGTIVAQSDGVPANWTRPTTGWLPGEYIVDSHQLTLPSELDAGPYQLRIGIYLPQGERLTTLDGANSVLIGVGE